MSNQAMKILVGCGVVWVVLASFVIAFRFAHLRGTMGSEEFATPEDPTGEMMCTMDAKLCPDGSAVRRSGPNCEFLPCPGMKGDER